MQTQSRAEIDAATKYRRIDVMREAAAERQEQLGVRGPAIEERVLSVHRLQDQIRRREVLDRLDLRRLHFEILQELGLETGVVAERIRKLADFPRKQIREVIGVAAADGEALGERVERQDSERGGELVAH